MSFATAYDKECYELLEILELKHATELHFHVVAGSIITVDATIEVQKEQLGKMIRVLKNIKFIEAPQESEVPDE